MIAVPNPRMNATGYVGLLAGAVERIARTSGDHRTALPELTVYRRNRPSQPVHCFYTLGMALTVQGSKHVLLGDKDLSYGPGHALLTTMDLPVSYHITRATVTEPYLGILLKFDRSLITQVASKVEAVRPSNKAAVEPIWIQRPEAPVLDAFHRLVSLLDEPALIPQLAPLIQQEIIVRLLTGTHGEYLRNVVNAASPTQLIARAITWIRQNLAEEMRVGDLAEHANMSLTTFRERFRSVTGMSPVQFQKMLRLQEARQLMLDQSMSAGRASALVGYESASQFTREYKRMFGAPPQTDIRLRST